MAEIRKVISFASGDTAMIDTIASGSPSVASTPAPPNSKYCVVADASVGSSVISFLFPESGNDQGLINTSGNYASPFKYTFKVRFDDVTPTNAVKMVQCGNSGLFAETDLALRLNTNGDVDILSGGTADTIDATFTTPFTANTWHEISIWYQRSATGNAEVVIDGTSKTTSSKDYLGSVTTSAGIHFRNAASPDTEIIVYLAELVMADGVTANSDLQNVYDVYEWRPGGTPTGTGSALTAGSWGNTGEDPLSESNTANYDGSTLKGFAEFDSTGGGPATDASTPTDTYAAATYWQWAQRGTGGGTTQNL